MDTIELVGEALRLRAWRINDAPSLVEAVRSSADSVGRYLPWCHENYRLADAIDWIARCRSGWCAGEHFAFGLFDDASGELLGGAGLRQHDHLQHCANLGYWVRASRQRQGVATTAARCVAGFGFKCLTLRRIETVASTCNQASRGTAENCGARLEGIARQRLWKSGRGQDAAVHGLLPQDLL